jgi:tetratricopeptide (TPR) repeat protein
MASEIKREEAGQITKKLHNCHIHLKKGNIYSCLTGFRDALELMQKIQMLPADQKQLQKDVNAFQYELASSHAFRHLYGPVTFSDDDIPTALDFMKQLIMIKDEEIMEAMEKQKQEEATKGAGANDNLQRRVYDIMLLVEKGEFAVAKERADRDEEAREVLIEMYNTTGIESRKAEDFEKAIKSFKNAIFISPADECLHYNLAHAYIGATDWKAAKNSMEEGLKVNPEFREGVQLMAFIDKNMQ